MLDARARLCNSFLPGLSLTPGLEGLIALLQVLLRGGHEDAGGSLLVCGDGPVEIREGRRRGALALDVASDEVRRYGWNTAKRARLIRAGADFLVPDWSQRERLVGLLFG